MSGILYIVGAIAAMAGVVMIGFGIPVNEFSFGNTLIISGVTALVGGMIVAGLGVVVAQLQRLADSLVARSPVRPPRPLDNMFGGGASRDMAGAARDMTGVQFPAKPKAADPRIGAPSPAEGPAEEGSTHSFEPVLRNPEEAEVTVEDDVSLSPRHPQGGRAAGDFDEPARNMPYGHESAVTERKPEPMLDSSWRPTPRPPEPRKSHSTYFDAMWPADDKSAKDADRHAESHTAAASMSEPAPQAEPEPPAAIEDEAPPVAILKSGVVDGMGYTLYVDGSIEAELPQGTLRFASINELRSHLEKNA